MRGVAALSWFVEFWRVEMLTWLGVGAWPELVGWWGLVGGERP